AAADARHRPRAHVVAEAAAGRRAFGGPRADPGVAHHHQDQGAEGQVRPDGADGRAELPPGDPHRRPRLHHRARRDRVRRRRAAARAERAREELLPRNLKPALRHVHVGMYGAVMGLAGLGLTARAAASVWPGVFRAPAYFTEPWVLLGAATLAVLIPLYLMKGLASLKEDFTNPMLMGFCGALPVGMSLVAGGLGPYLPAFSHGLWWVAFALLTACQVWALIRLLSGGLAIGDINPGWLIILVG